MMRKLLPVIICLSVFVGILQADLKFVRPPFDKTPYLKTVWSAANPWWLPNKSRTHGEGGPDFAWHKFSDDGTKMWEQVATWYCEYGLTGLQMEMISNNGYMDVFFKMLDGFKNSGTEMMGQPFITDHPSSFSQAQKNYMNLFDKLAPVLKKHPNAYRLNGMPVVVLYTPHSRKPYEWREIIKQVESKHGRMIWLMNAYQNYGKSGLRNYIAEFDGITMYGNWSTQMQKEFFAKVVPIMKHEFPEKIFEAAVHTVYCVHFHYGGVVPKLTEKYLTSWDITLESQPDAITITNWFDTYENSRIMPSYELEDSMLKIAQQKIATWQGKEPPATDKPDLYVFNYTTQMIGKPLHFEVMGFPMSAEDKNVKVEFAICDEVGKIIHQFPTKQLKLDEMQNVVYTLDSLQFASYRAVFPFLKYTWNGKTHAQIFFNPTILVTSLRPHQLFWARSVKNAIMIDTEKNWTLNGKTPGELAKWQSGHIGSISAKAVSYGAAGFKNRGGGWVRILRNGREIESFPNYNLRFNTFIRMPDPGGAMDYYSLELENSGGCRYLSAPIWVSSGERSGEVELPVLLPSGNIETVSVEASRVPYFQYDCDRNTGRILEDVSGYEHHGCLAGKKLERTAYRHEHIGKMPPESCDVAPVWAQDKSGKTYLKFDGNDYIIIGGGTAFPYASTYEMSILPEDMRREQTILAGMNGQIFIKLNKDGKIVAGRKQAIESAGGATPDEYSNGVGVVESQKPLKIRKWTKIAVVYDLKNFSLYIDGKLQGEIPLRPTRSAESINQIVIGGAAKFPYDASPSYKGGIRNIRIYGRNLKPEEFFNNEEK